jgi:hypothetical protein
MRRLTLPLAVVALAVVAAYSAYWIYVARQLRAGLEPWAAARRSEGYALHWDKTWVGGFPVAFRLHFENVAIGAPRPLLYDAGAPTLELSAAPWNLHRWRVTAAKGGHVAAPGAGVALYAHAIGGTVTLDAPTGTEIALTAHDVTGRGLAEGFRVADATAAATLPAKAPESHLDDALSLSLRLAQATLPRTVRPFGTTIDSLSLAATLKGALPAGALRPALAAWRDDGGTVELKSASLNWGALMVDASGTLALDGDLQPIGSLTATIAGQDAVIDAAVAAGGLRAQDAGIAKTILGLMAKTGPDGRKRLTLPVSVQNDRLYLGPAQIASLPRIAWQ